MSQQITTPTEQFRAFVDNDDFPCVGAKSALVRSGLDIREYRALERPTDDVKLRTDLIDFLNRIDLTSPLVQSFVAIFPEEIPPNEEAFEKALWNRLQSLHNLDAVAGEEWSGDVSSDPESSHFSMSVAGRAFFVVGLNPHASRPARRFAFPTLVFNSHEQFEALRADGRYEKMQNIIRSRELSVAGDINPMLKDHGLGSSAAQYSGRQAPADWKCPFEAQEPKN